MFQWHNLMWQLLYFLLLYCLMNLFHSPNVAKFFVLGGSYSYFQPAALHCQKMVLFEMSHNYQRHSNVIFKEFSWWLKIYVHRSFFRQETFQTGFMKAHHNYIHSSLLRDIITQQVNCNPILQLGYLYKTQKVIPAQNFHKEFQHTNLLHLLYLNFLHT